MSTSRYPALLLAALAASSCGADSRMHGDLAVPLDFASPPGDSYRAPDLTAAPDLAVVLDLSGAAPDMAPPPDLVRPADLIKPGDFSQGVSCINGPPCPPNTVCCMVGLRAGTCYSPACLACCM